MKVHCHLCGATLRRVGDFHWIRRLDTGDEIVVCADVERCDRRIASEPFGAVARDDAARAAVRPGARARV